MMFMRSPSETMWTGFAANAALFGVNSNFIESATVADPLRA